MQTRFRTAFDQRLIQRLLEPFARFVQLESSSSIVLLLMTASALLVSNSRIAPVYEVLQLLPLGVTIGSFSMHTNLHALVNDGLMPFFFLTVGLEIKRELVVGELASIRRAMLPVLAAIGGVIVPALIYFALNGSGPAARGWGIPIATDIAFSLTVLTMFNSRIPVALKVFLVSLAIVDDIAGVAVIAIAYTHAFHLGMLLLVGFLFLVCLGLNRLGVTLLPIYMTLGVALWWALHASGIHAALAGILLALAIPVRIPISAEGKSELRRVPLEKSEVGSVHAGGPRNETHESASGHRGGRERSESPLNRLEAKLHPWVSFGVVPLFALMNAGIRMQGFHANHALEHAFSGIFLGLVLGKPIGITLFSWIAVRLRLADLPYHVGWLQLHAVAWLGGIGFTVSIFIARLAFDAKEQYAMACVAVLVASLCAAGVGSLLLAVIHRKSRALRAHD